MRYAINPTNMKLVKDAAWAALPQVGSSHLSEALAAGFGYKTNASLQSALKASTVTVEFNEGAFAGRLRTVAPSVPYTLGLMFPVLASIPEIQTRLKHLTVSKVTAIIGLVEAANQRQSGSGARRLSIGAGGNADAVVDAILRGPSPAVIDLYSAIKALNHDELMELMGLMWIGRDYDGTFEDAVSHAYRNSDAGDVMYIAEKRPVLAKYLRGGLAKIGFHVVSERASNSMAAPAITKHSDACPNLGVFSDLLIGSQIPY
ncbi:DUF3775 domain-containing protein [Azospirillum ramasamyi]|nr:DUF3775 domain-containing protein [Azospirillum ramasamyi]